MSRPQRISVRNYAMILRKLDLPITIMPSSFVVRAKDSQGKPVMMVINPDSLTK